MWKEFFYFSRGQRVGILILLALIGISLLLFWLMPYFFKSKEEIQDTAFLQEAEQFKANLIEKERTQKARYENYYENNYYSKSNENARYQLFNFDPNSADSVTFVRLGIKPYIAKNILKYRSKGGKFRKAEDFGRVYGLNPEKFEELLPYIHIADAANQQSAMSATQESDPLQQAAGKAESAHTQKKDIVVELNSSDTALLMQVSGIGKTYAKRIVGYRKILGGYVTVEQLQEVYGMTPENYLQISPQCRVDVSQVQKINVNTASIERLKAHPYIKTFQKAKAIYEYRRKKVKLNGINDLKVLDELTEEDLRKLEPYLEFK